MLGELDDIQIDDVLRTATVGRIGCRGDGRVYVVPISYAYDGECVYGHSADGLKLRLMRADPDVCFEVEDVREMTDWRSVVAHGRFEELHGPDAAEAMARLTDRFRHVATSSTANPPGPATGQGHGHGGGRAPVLYRIRLHSRTGRFESPG